MRLEDGGIDIYYVDESMDAATFAITAVSIPFLRPVDGTWTIVWEDQFRNVREWRRRANRSLHIPVKKELKGQKLLSGRGRYKYGLHQFTRTEGAQAYHAMLADTGFLADNSIISVVGHRRSNLMGHTKLEALVIALLQRMRTACHKTQRNGFVFFDQGHGEYRKLYRRARVYLPTGSRLGGWGQGQATMNLPLDNFTKDANIKESQHSFFIQLADLLSHAVFLKIKSEQGSLTPWQTAVGAGTIYDSVPLRVLNTNAARNDRQGIVRL